MFTDKRSLDRADKAVLRLAIGLGLAVLVAYGLALTMPYAVCVMAFLVLCKPGPPIPFFKGVILALVIAAFLAAGVLMVPILENYALTGVMLTAALLYGVFFSSGGSASPKTTILALAIALIPIIGVAEQALAPLIAGTLALGVCTGALVSGASHALFPDAPLPANQAEPPAIPSRETASWMALRATLVVMPVFLLALSNPVFYVAAVLKSVALGQQACSTSARSAGWELVGSTVMGAWLATLAWFGLSLWANLWMLMLWMVAAALWVGARLFRVKATSFPPSFWRNAMVTMLILLGPAMEDSANGKDVFKASATRVSLFIAVALYAWATVWVLERWRAARSEARPFKRN